MLGTIANCCAIIGGCIVGLFIKGKMTDKISETIMNGLALCVLYIGIAGTLEGENTLMTIVCMAIGALIGELIDIDNLIIRLGDKIESKFKKEEESNKISIRTTKHIPKFKLRITDLIYCKPSPAKNKSLNTINLPSF